MNLHLGCGSRLIDGWINVDYAIGARLAKIPLLRTVARKAGLIRHRWDHRIYIHDLRKPFPWRTSTVDVVYSAHTLEHLSKEEGLRFLKECHRVLRPQGILRIVVPDLARFIGKYAKGALAADDFVEALGVLGPNRGILAKLVHFPHRCMYDEKRLSEIMTAIGFEGTSRCAGLQSAIPDISLTGESAAQTSLTVEGRKGALS
jgi:SAM-dependent methyltransferase